MPLKKKARPEASIEVGSFSDISFLLIIFFVLTTSLERPAGRLINIPSAAPPETQASSEDKTPTVNILPDRILVSEGSSEKQDELTLPELRTSLVGRAFPSLPEKDRMVVVEVGEEVDYDRYFKVVSMIAETGGIVAVVEE